MTETEFAEHVIETHAMPNDDVDVLARRTFAAELTPGDGRTVDLRVIPYGERVEANDGLGGLPRGVVYREEFSPGVFDGQINAANRVFLDVEHEGQELRRGRAGHGGIVGVIGHGVALRSEADGLYGSFRVHETPSGDTALELVRAGSLSGASVECLFLKSIRAADGVVRRVRGHLERVALCRTPAYPGAVVLGVRSASPVVVDEELLPATFDAELASRIAALGITIPDRLLAHPVTDTAAPTVTPETTPANGDDDNPNPEV